MVMFAGKQTFPEGNTVPPWARGSLFVVGGAQMSPLEIIDILEIIEREGASSFEINWRQVKNHVPRDNSTAFVMAKVSLVIDESGAEVTIDDNVCPYRIAFNRVLSVRKL